MDLGVGHVPPVRLRLGRQERRVVAAPQHQQRRLVRAQPLLPGRIAGDVGAVVVEQVGLEVVLPWSAEKGDFVGPQVRVVLLRDGAAADVPLPGRRGREEVLAQRRLVGGAVRPERPAGVPQRAEAVFVRDRVLHDHRPHAVGVRGRQPEPDRAAVVLHEQGVPAEAELIGEAPDDLGQVLEGVGEAGRVGGVAVAEARVVRRDQVEGVCQPGQQRLPHPRGGREAVQQQDGGSVGRARLAVEDRHPVDVGRLVDRVAHDRPLRNQAAAPGPGSSSTSPAWIGSPQRAHRRSTPLTSPQASRRYSTAAVKYTGAPYSRGQERVVGVVEPVRQTVGVG